MKEIEVTITLITNHKIKGKLNLAGHTRLSDLLETNNKILKLFKATQGGQPDKTLLILKNQVLYIEPKE